MPQYLILRVKGTGRSQKSNIIGFTPTLRNGRSAWVYYKKNFKRSLKKDYIYHVLPINHARIWAFKDGKWRISAWYGNHNQKEYRKKESSRMMESFKRSGRYIVNEKM